MDREVPVWVVMMKRLSRPPMTLSLPARLHFCWGKQCGGAGNRVTTGPQGTDSRASVHTRLPHHGGTEWWWGCPRALRAQGDDLHNCPQWSHSGSSGASFTQCGPSREPCQPPPRWPRNEGLGPEGGPGRLVCTQPPTPLHGHLLQGPPPWVHTLHDDSVSSFLSEVMYQS